MLKLRTKIEAISLVSLLVILSFSSAWAVTRNIQSNKETISGGTYYFNGNYDWINNSHFNLSNKIYNSKGHVWNASGANIQPAAWDLNGTGGIVWLPNYNLSINKPIVITQNHTAIYGSEQATIIHPSDTFSGDSLIQLGSYLNNAQYFELRQITLFGLNAITGKVDYGLNISSAQYGIVEHIEITQFSVAGILLDALDDHTNTHQISFRNIHMSGKKMNGVTGVQIRNTGLTEVNDITFDSVFVENFGNLCTAYNVSGCQKISFKNCFAGVNGTGFRLTTYGSSYPMEGVVLEECYGEMSANSTFIDILATSQNIFNTVIDGFIAVDGCKTNIKLHNLNNQSSPYVRGTIIRDPRYFTQLDVDSILIWSYVYDTYVSSAGGDVWWTRFVFDNGSRTQIAENMNVQYFYPRGVADNVRFSHLVNVSADGSEYIFIPGWYNWSGQVLLRKQVDIYLMPGVNITSTAAANMFYFGSGSAGSIIHGTGTVYGNNSYFSGSVYSFYISVNNVTLRDFTSASAQYADIRIISGATGTKIDGMRFYGDTTQYNIYMAGCDYVTVEDCFVNSNGGNGFMTFITSDNRGIVVKNNEIRNKNLYGLVISNCSWSEFTGNTIENPGSTGIIITANVNNCTFSNNKIYDVGNINYGIQLGNTGNPSISCKNNTVTGNIITGFSRGIYLLNANNTIAKDNIITACTNPIYITKSLGYFRDNVGYKTENNGNTSVSNNGTINHGLSATPTVVVVTTFNVNLTAHVIQMSSTTFKVCLIDIHTGSPPGGSWPVYWEAKV